MQGPQRGLALAAASWLLVAACFARAGGAGAGAGAESESESASAAGSPFRRVHLRCGADHMWVSVEAAPDFDGVVYTRGSFHERRPPCFASARARTRSSSSEPLTLRFPLDRCHTRRDAHADAYDNVLVVQADEDLVMPGDAAFALRCDFGRPRDVAVAAALPAPQGGDAHRPVSSRITLVEADPAAEAVAASRRGRRRRDAAFVANASDEVQLLVDDALRLQEQLQQLEGDDDEEDEDEEGEEEQEREDAPPRKDEL